MTVIIGRGEVTAVKILKELYPTNTIIETQVPLSKLLYPPYRLGVSERQQKETIDILVKRKFKKPMCIRIQDKHHSNNIMSKIDNVQKKLLEWSFNYVIDVEERECPELFKDNLNVKSREELKYYLKSHL